MLLGIDRWVSQELAVVAEFARVHLDVLGRAGGHGDPVGGCVLEVDVLGQVVVLYGALVGVIEAQFDADILILVTIVFIQLCEADS